MARSRAGSIAGSRETLAPIVLRKLLDEGISPGTLINVNFPDCPPDQVKGIAVTVQGRRDADLLKIDARHDGRGIPYYWIAFQRGAFTPGKGPISKRSRRRKSR